MYGGQQPSEGGQGVFVGALVDPCEASQAKHSKAVRMSLPASTAEAASLR